MKPSLMLVLAAVAVALPTGSGSYSSRWSTSHSSTFSTASLIPRSSESYGGEIYGGDGRDGSKNYGAGDSSYQYGPSDGSSSSDASGSPDGFGTSPTRGSSPSASPYISSPPAYPSGTSSSSSPSNSSFSSSGGNNGTTSSVGGPIVDDYPTEYKDSCGSIDQWSLTACQCTSFVAWRIDQRLNSGFSRSFDHETWSNANTWATAAQGAGLTVDNTPEVGAIAQTTAGEDGHVAWVCGVNGDQIQIEEYNALNNQAYDTRTVSATDYQFIHIPVSSSGS